MNKINVIIISAAIVLSAALLGHAWVKTHESKTSISVTGLSSKEFISDLIVWKASFNRKAPALKDAYSALKKDAGEIKKYLLAKGLNENEIVFSSVDIRKDYDKVKENNFVKEIFTGYSLTQSVKIEAHDVDKIEFISRQVTELIDSGIELYSEAPQYYYTKLSELKIEMLAAASKDAHNRAEKIIENAGGKLGRVRVADMGVFQITAPNSSEEYSWGGAFNTTSKRKTASITVKLEFQIW
jgi:hypothetical protein